MRGGLVGERGFEPPAPLVPNQIPTPIESYGNLLVLSELILNLLHAVRGRLLFFIEIGGFDSLIFAYNRRGNGFNDVASDFYERLHHLLRKNP